MSSYNYINLKKKWDEDLKTILYVWSKIIVYIIWNFHTFSVHKSVDCFERLHRLVIFNHLPSQSIISGILSSIKMRNQRSGASVVWLINGLIVVCLSVCASVRFVTPLLHVTARWHNNHSLLLHQNRKRVVVFWSFKITDRYILEGKNTYRCSVTGL